MYVDPCTTGQLRLMGGNIENEGRVDICINNLLTSQPTLYNCLVYKYNTQFVEQDYSLTWSMQFILCKTVLAYVVMACINIVLSL